MQSFHFSELMIEPNAKDNIEVLDRIVILLVSDFEKSYKESSISIYGKHKNLIKPNRKLVKSDMMLNTSYD